MATEDGQPDGLEFRDRIETLMERMTDKFDQLTSRHLASLLDYLGVTVDDQAGDCAGNAT